MNILITGGCGFVGSNLSNNLTKSGHSITIIDDLSTGKIENIESKSTVDIIESDIRKHDSLESIIHKKKFDAIIHLAAIASVQKSKENPILANEVNFQSTINLLDIACKNNVKQFLFASSAAVYGDDQILPKNETKSIIQPISTYAIDKYASEQYVINFAKEKKIAGTAFRFFNVYGPNQDPTSPYSGVLSLFLDAVIKSDNPEITIFGDGKQTRDFIYIKDIISAIEFTLNNEKLSGQVFNLATGKETSLLNVINYLNTISSKQLKINFQPGRSGDIYRSVANISKLLETGYTVKYSFETGIKEYFDHLIANR